MEEQKNQDWMMDNFTASMSNLEAGRWWSLFGASVSHKELPHLLGNVFGLWLFGNMYQRTFL